MAEIQLENLTTAEIETLAVALDSVISGPGWGTVTIEIKARRIQNIAVTVTFKPSKE